MEIERKKEEFTDKFWEEFKRQKKEDKIYDFSEFIFPDSISFENIEFNKDTYFREAEFSGEITSFMSTKFTGENTNFGGAQFTGKYTDFRGAQFTGEDTDFRGAQFTGENTYFSGAQFTGKTIDFYNSYFKNVYGLFDALKNRGIPRIWKSRYKISDFRIHLGEESAARHPVINRMTKDAWYLADFQREHPFVYRIWNVSSKCGQKISYWIGWSLLFASFFAVKFYLIYFSFPSYFHFNPAIKSHSIWSFIYYSFVTFTTLGFGDIIPTTDWVQIWVIAEVVLGYIMLGGLISIFANKLARRSY